MKPNVGMVYPVCAPVSTYTPGTNITYSTGSVIDEARAASVSWDRSDSEFYGDDVLLDTDNGITGYTIEFEPTGLQDTVRVTLLGEVLSSSEYSITDAAAPFVGFGYIRVMRSNSGATVSTTYEGWWYYRVQFSVSSEETRTKEKTIEWRTPTLSGKGTGVQLSSGNTPIWLMGGWATAAMSAASVRPWPLSQASSRMVASSTCSRLCMGSALTPTRPKSEETVALTRPVRVSRSASTSGPGASRFVSTETMRPAALPGV